MQPIEIIVIIAAVSAVAFSIIYGIMKKKNGGGCTDCGCCPYGASCQKREGEKKQ